MSPLTKVFVVLLVVTSMLSTAGFVVFVQNIRPLQPQLDAERSAEESARQQAGLALAAKEQAEAQRDQEIANHQADRTKDAAVLAMSEKNLNDAQVQIAQLQAEKTNLQATVNTLNSNLALTASTADKLNQQVADLRTRNDALTKQSEDDTKQLSDLTSQTETQGATLEQTQEKLQAELERDQKLSGWVRDHSGSPDDIVAGGSTAVGAAAPAIDGRILEKSTINGVPYVTISVGSADGVERGMQFYVVDPVSAQFLGIVTIDTVDSNNSIGKLDGDADKIAQVRAGNDVKTQLRGS
ncbi:MAG: hypothetical protein ABSF29_02630 [Tepidisphaeraceae bacterium]